MVERSEEGTWREPVRPPHPGKTELTGRLVADGGQPILIREEGAVRHDRGVAWQDSAVTEPTAFETHLEAEPQRVAGLERPLQGVDPVAEIFVGEHASRRSVEGYRSGLDARNGGHVDGVDWHSAVVHEEVDAADLRLPL